MIAAVSLRKCRECGVTDEILDGFAAEWVEPDLCSTCRDSLIEQDEADARRYRWLRNRQTRSIDIAAGGLFAGQIPDNKILGGEDLDRAIDAAMGLDISPVPPLERRLAECLADIIDTAIFTGSGESGGYSSPLEIRLGFFRPDASERAAQLLEEAGL
jgi:hypothetical protein